jgi:hypothetical protein
VANSIISFSQLSLEKLGNDPKAYYVYALAEPSGDIFYIGKGKGNRLFAHEEAFDRGGIIEVLADEESKSVISDKLSRIGQIRAEGQSVKRFIIRKELSESEALMLESSLIDVLSLDKLENEVAGHNSALITVEDFEIQNGAKPIEQFYHKTLLIKINREWVKLKSEERSLTGVDEYERRLYDATRMSWVLSRDRAKKCEIALSIAFGLVREVYMLEDWYPVGKRWAFTGRKAEQSIRELYYGRSVAEIFPNGAQNPITYQGFGTKI